MSTSLLCTIYEWRAGIVNGQHTWLPHCITGLELHGGHDACRCHSTGRDAPQKNTIFSAKTAVVPFFLSKFNIFLLTPTLAFGRLLTAVNNNPGSSIQQSWYSTVHSATEIDSSLSLRRIFVIFLYYIFIFFSSSFFKIVWFLIRFNLISISWIKKYDLSIPYS